MSAFSDLQKRLEKEAQGIMFPFAAKKPTVDTTQQVYNSATDGIMTMQGKQYVGPDSVIQYGSEEQGYPRQLKQIEAPMLPQFDETQFPKAGEGIVQTPTPAPTPPVETEPETPAVDPCPPGFKLIDGVCRPIEKPKEDGGQKNIIIDKRRNIGDTANALGQVTDALNSLPGEQGEKLKDTYGKDVNLTINNDIPWLKFIPLIGTPLNMYLKDKADKQLQTLNGTEGISVTKNKDGTYNVNVTEEKGKANFGRLQTKESLAGNMASTQKKDASGNIVKAPNGQNMIQGPLTLSAFGKTNLFAPENEIKRDKGSFKETQKSFVKKLQDRTQTIEALNAEEKNKLLSELDTLLGKDSTATGSNITGQGGDFGNLVATDSAETGSNITGQGGDFGELVTIDTKDSQTGETIGTVNKRFTDNITTGHFRLSNTLATIENLQKRAKSLPRGGNVTKQIEKAKDVAEEEFNETIQEDRNKGNNSLSKSQRDYLDSDNRRALAGETKSDNGKDVDSRKGFVKGRDNQGYGFKSTSANYNKATKTFDQRFK